MAFKKFSSVAWQGKRTAVKKVIYPDNRVSYDMWEWNLYKRSWVRLVNAGGFGDLSGAIAVCERRDKEIEDMIQANITSPEPL